MIILGQFFDFFQSCLYLRWEEVGFADGVKSYSVLSKQTPARPVRFHHRGKSAGNHAPMCAKVQERVFGQMHQPIDLFFWALEVVDGKGIYRDEFDFETETYFQNLVLMN